MKAYWGSGGVSPRILDIGTRWRRMASLTPQQLYCRWKTPRQLLVRRVGGPHSLPGRGGEEKNSQHCTCRELNPGRLTRILVKNTSFWDMLVQY